MDGLEEELCRYMQLLPHVQTPVGRGFGSGGEGGGAWFYSFGVLNLGGTEADICLRGAFDYTDS